MTENAEVVDKERTYSKEEQQLLTAKLDTLVTKIHNGKLDDRPITIDLISSLHRSLFDGVRDFAGLLRTRGSGSEYLNFGPNRSTQNRLVDQELKTIISEHDKSKRSFAGNETDENFIENAIHLASWIHAELIRVHPFEDGNGRTSRLVFSLVLRQLGLQPIAITTPKQEYNECLNNYFETREIQPLVDLAIRNAADQIPT